MPRARGLHPKQHRVQAEHGAPCNGHEKDGLPLSRAQVVQVGGTVRFLYGAEFNETGGAYCEGPVVEVDEEMGVVFFLTEVYGHDGSVHRDEVLPHPVARQGVEPTRLLVMETAEERKARLAAGSAP